jgi:uncharacterized protein (DUF885 family)
LAAWRVAVHAKRAPFAQKSLVSRGAASNIAEFAGDGHGVHAEQGDGANRLAYSSRQRKGAMMVQTRRNFLVTTALTSVAVAAGMPAWADAASEGKKLSALFDAFMGELLDNSPTLATSLGVDTGTRAHERAELDDNSLKGIAAASALLASQVERLKAIDRTALSDADRLNYDVVLDMLAIRDEIDKRYDYGNRGWGVPCNPYVVNQLDGLYSKFPDFLENFQPVENKADAEAYISRLAKVDRALDNDTEVVRHDAGLGVIAPDFVLTRTLAQLRMLRAVPPEQSVMVTAIGRRMTKHAIDGDYQARALAITTTKVYPALDRQIAALTELQSKATHDAGVWKLPKGDQYYRDCLAFWTTTSMAPDDIHKAGLDMVADYTRQLDVDLKKQGLSKGTVGERLRGLFNDPRFRYPNTDAGKEKLLADLNTKVHAIRTKLPDWFGVLPKADLVIQRVPKFTEAGAPGGYYSQGTLDGKRPGIYYINLRDTAEVPSWTLPSTTYHEGIPGHHLQLSIQQEVDTPLIRKIAFFSAYMEGWAHYAEQLADEMGMYADDPWGRIGYLHDALFRGVRLVLDTGIHTRRWSREQAIKYFIDTMGDPEASATSEVERYCVEAGQACAYALGKLTILHLRDKARAALGSRFSIKAFHDAVLTHGAVPLDVLERMVDAYVKAQG